MGEGFAQPTGWTRWVAQSLHPPYKTGSEDGPAEVIVMSARSIALATLHELHLDGKLETKALDKAIKELGINPDKPNPVIS